MDTKKDTNYFELVQKEFKKLQKLQTERGELDVRIAKSKQFIAATANMLHDRQRDAVFKMMGTIEAGKLMAELGLTDAIRAILKKNHRQWLTVTQVRDRLEIAGFDFSNYRSSPLASISTTLKRFAADDVERAEIDGVAAYRWIGKLVMEPPKTPWLHTVFIDDEMGTLKDLAMTPTPDEEEKKKQK
jgi:hypothetical protein